MRKAQGETKLQTQPLRFLSKVLSFFCCTLLACHEGRQSMMHLLCPGIEVEKALSLLLIHTALFVLNSFAATRLLKTFERSCLR